MKLEIRRAEVRRQEELVSNEIALNANEIEYLKKVHVATAIREMTKHPGYDHFCKISKMIIERLENQHLQFAPKGTKDAYWASGLRLAGAREYAMILEGQINQIIDLPDQPLTTRRNGPEPEGDYDNA